jgi:hypothetical protein
VRKWLWPALGLTAWVGALGFGFHALWKYKADPAEQGRPPARWPADSRLAQDRDRPTLVMFAHPRCPCTAASLTELRNLIARVGPRVRPYVVVYRPTEVGADWERTALWDRSEAIPGVTVVRDDEGREAQRFQALASGLVVLYDRQGRRVFDGGLTASRGHEGDSFGRRRILAVLDGVTPDRDQSPVFGCAIAGPAAETEGRDAHGEHRHEEGG